ncbi:MAG TPA: regulatory iron-sulfur-containing complex subunit RicT [Polyangia bacterium]
MGERGPARSAERAQHEEPPGREPPARSVPAPRPSGPTGEAPLARPSAEIDSGWGLPDESAAAAEPEPTLRPTEPPPPDPRDPDGDDVFLELGEGESPAAGAKKGALTNVAGIKFRPAGTIHAYDAGDASYLRGERVVVESDRGPIVATVAVGSRRQPTLDVLRRIVRPATAADEKSKERNGGKEREAYLFCKQRIRDRNLAMKLTRVEYPLAAGNKVLFYFASEERVDFRELVKDLAQRLKARIEMRQIGARDEAKMVGGIGACGRELCCSTWLPAFVPISIKMAKDQGLPLNPSKVSGQCGRLKCCLVYEQDTYKEMRKGLPKMGKRVATPGGEGKVVELDVLRQRVRVWFDEGGSETFPADVITLLAPPGARPAASAPSSEDSETDA